MLYLVPNFRQGFVSSRLFLHGLRQVIPQPGYDGLAWTLRRGFSR